MSKPANISKLLSLIFATARAIRKQSNSTLGKTLTKMTLLHLETLGFISQNKQVSMKDLADYLCVAPPSVTSLVDELVGSGYIARKPDLSDRRVIQLVITQNGEKTLRKMMQEKTRKMSEFFGKLNPQEQNDLIKILEKISQSQAPWNQKDRNKK